MKVIKINNLSHENKEIVYLRNYTGEALLELYPGNIIEIKISFIYEEKAHGAPSIKINILDDLDYPLVPVIRSLKAFIEDLGKQGELN